MSKDVFGSVARREGQDRKDALETALQPVSPWRAKAFIALRPLSERIAVRHGEDNPVKGGAKRKLRAARVRHRARVRRRGY